MGLDLLELQLDCEETFGIYIPDSEGYKITTPFLLASYIFTRIRNIEERRCLSQMGFYKIRQILVNEFGANRKDIKPNTDIRTYLGMNPIESWAKFKQAINNDGFYFQLTLSPSTKKLIYIIFPLLIALFSFLSTFPGELLFVMLASYYLITQILVNNIGGRTIPSKYSQVRSFIPLISCSKSQRLTQEEVLNKVLEITASHSGIDINKISQHDDFVNDLGLD
jgi:acyl carrier protein